MIHSSNANHNISKPPAIETAMYTNARIGFARDIESQLRARGYVEHKIVIDKGLYKLSVTANDVEVLTVFSHDRPGLMTPLINSNDAVDAIFSAVRVCSKSNPDHIGMIIDGVYDDRMAELSMHDPASTIVFEIAVNACYAYLKDQILISYEEDWT